MISLGQESLGDDGLGSLYQVCDVVEASMMTDHQLCFCLPVPKNHVMEPEFCEMSDLNFQDKRDCVSVQKW